MSEAATGLRKEIVERVLRGDGKTASDTRAAAFSNTPGSTLAPAVQALVDKTAKHAWKVVDDDVEAAKRAGLSDDEIFELVVCAAIGQATRQLDAGLAAVEAAFAPEQP